MIVKVKNTSEKDEGESWSYFECQIVHSHYLAFGKIVNMADMVILLENKEIKKDTVVRLLNLETTKQHFRTILTDRVCYILNNEGKTIDKI